MAPLFLIVGGVRGRGNALVKPFGLITDGRLHDTVCERNDDELIFGMPDSHLTFHASLWCGACQQGRQVISITTVVRYNNRFGRIYFFFVRPFHRIIMQTMLSRVERHAGEQ